MLISTAKGPRPGPQHLYSTCTAYCIILHCLGPTASAQAWAVPSAQTCTDLHSLSDRSDTAQATASLTAPKHSISSTYISLSISPSIPTHPSHLSSQTTHPHINSTMASQTIVPSSQPEQDGGIESFPFLPDYNPLLTFKTPQEEVDYLKANLNKAHDRLAEMAGYMEAMNAALPATEDLVWVSPFNLISLSLTWIPFLERKQWDQQMMRMMMSEFTL